MIILGSNLDEAPSSGNFYSLGGQRSSYPLEKTKMFETLDLHMMLGKSERYYPKWWFNGDESHGIPIRKKAPTKTNPGNCFGNRH